MNSSVGAGDQRREILQLKGEREDVRVGRRFLAHTLIRLGWDDRVDDASLLLSELLANVALHARTGCSVAITDTPGLLRVEVEDGSPVLPRVQHYSIDTTTGRGLRLVEKLAQSWGIERTPAGKMVWFALDHASSGSVPAAGTDAISSRQGPPAGEPDLDAVLRRLGASDEGGLSLLAILEPAL